MDETGFAALQAQLGGEAPAGLASLDPAQMEDLAGAIRDARRRQAVEIAAAGERALGFIPRLLRGPIKKVVGA